jgi:hypothetical protein
MLDVYQNAQPAQSSHKSRAIKNLLIIVGEEFKRFHLIPGF